jgi:hypothetical protein
MTNGRWVTVPGKGRRFVTDAGEYRYGDPNAPLAPLAKSVKNFFEQLNTSQISPEKFRSLAAPGLSSIVASPARAAEFTGPPVPARLANAPTAPALPSFTPGQTAGERAYTAEKERARQLTAQDPLLKKYQVADLTKKYNAATGDERERIGLQIWAQTNPDLAANLRPGQTGYAEMQAAPGYNTGLGTTTSSFGQYTQGVTTPNVDIDSNTFTKRLPSDLLSSVGITTPSSLEGMPFAPGKGLEQLLPNVDAYNTQIDFNAFRPNLEEKQRQLLIQAYNRGLK